LAANVPQDCCSTAKICKEDNAVIDSDWPKGEAQHQRGFILYQDS